MIELTMNGFPFPKRTRKMYSCSAVKMAIEEYTKIGADIYQFAPESLGYGGLLIVPHDHDKYYCLIIEEKYLNEWSSAHTIRNVRYERIGKRIWGLVNQYEDREV